MHFKFERIFSLYYGCERLGNIVASCSFLAEEKKEWGMYGPWLKTEVSVFQSERGFVRPPP